MAWSPNGELLAVGGQGGKIAILDPLSGREIEALPPIVDTSSWTYSIVWSPDSSGIVFGTQDRKKSLVMYGRSLRKELWSYGHNQPQTYALGISWSPTDSVIACGFQDNVVRIIDASTGRALRVLEGHTDEVTAVSFSANGQFLASLSRNGDVRIWRTDVWEQIATLAERTNGVERWTPDLAFSPSEPLLATLGSHRGNQNARSRLIHIWSLDPGALLARAARPTSHYANAKVILVGDTGVGKSGLSLVLNNQPFEATESTPGRRVWVFDSKVFAGMGVTETRETLLWDLAGQPGYRVIHQLHLNELAVALVVFDARSEIDPLAGVRHWERALRLAEQRQGPSSIPMKKYLVSARNDRGGVSIGEERLKGIISEFGFDGYFKTSAKEWWGINELRTAIQEAIPWERLPLVSSSQLFTDIKAFLLDVKKTGRLLAPVGQLFEDFVRQHAAVARKVPDLRAQFDTCIGRLENRDLVRRLSFGGYVLLQSELLDAYGSALVNTAKEEPDGLGSIAEEIALAGRFFVPKEQKVVDAGQEQLLLHATVEELVRHDLALRENADDGRHLVFPSQFNRDYEDAPDPKGKALAITFAGPVQSFYATLAVRLGHSGLFTTGRAEMWRNAAVFASRTGGRCGLFVHEFAEGRGRLTIFYPDEHTTPETRFHFEEFVLAHARRRTLEGTMDLVRFFLCSECGDPVPDSYVKRLRDRGKMSFSCPCGATVSLAEPIERIHFNSKIEAMEQSADHQRDFEAFVVSAKGETSTKTFQEWAGGEQVTLAIVFTDIVDSTALAEEIRDEAMNALRRRHFAQSRSLIASFLGREIKTIGDSFLVAFKSAGAALNYARALQARTGSPRLRVRAGIHIGTLRIEEEDVFGGTVNFAARVVGAIKDAEVWLSERAKDDIEQVGSLMHRNLAWERREGVSMKGFPGKWTLWALRSP